MSNDRSLGLTGPLSSGDIRVYLEAVLSQELVPDDQGRWLIQCPVRPSVPHFIVMSSSDGQWVCQAGCGRGSILDFEALRSKLFGAFCDREARMNIQRILDAKKPAASSHSAHSAQPAARAVKIKAPKELDPYALRLLAHIARHPGKSRRYHQQTGHLHRLDFRASIRLLERQRLIGWRDERSTGGRRRRVYFPLLPSEP